MGDFAESAADDHHFTLDPVAGEIELGPAVREPDGSVRQFGAVPPKGATLRLRRYRTGGGRQGNVTRGALSVLRSSIPYVARVENRAAAAGGVDAEDLDNAKLRGPIMLRSRNRAVTAADHEALAREAAPEAARLRCVPAGEGTGPSDVRILVVPTVSLGEGGRLRFEQLIPSESTLRAIATHLDERRLVGARLAVHPPVYQGITVVARLRARTAAAARTLQDEALDVLYGYFNPLVGGPDRTGWPFGRPVNIGDVYAVLQQLPGLGYVEDARLFAADPISGQRGQASQRVDLDAHTLVFSFEHQVVVADG
jgi:predicted phage baseplate assembly protein